MAEAKEQKLATLTVDKVEVKTDKNKKQFFRISSIGTFRGSVNIYTEFLPGGTPKQGDVLHVIYTESEYEYNGKKTISRWGETGPIPDLAADPLDCPSAPKPPEQPGRELLNEASLRLAEDIVKYSFASVSVGMKQMADGKEVDFKTFEQRVKIVYDGLKAGK